jgi:putative phosphoribosyl transferase
MRLRDREEAGQRLAAALLQYRDEAPLVLALPRGGVPVAYEVARALDAPMDIWIVRKVGVPGHTELGLGAVAEGGHVFLSQEIMRYVGLSSETVTAAARSEAAEVERRVRQFRGDRPAPAVEGKTVILVDDGIATGGTVRAAILALRAQRARKIVLAVPVAAADSIEELRPEVDDVVCLLAPSDLYAIGLWYEDFRQVSDDEVQALLERARQAHAAAAAQEAGLIQ